MVILPAKEGAFPIKRTGCSNVDTGRVIAVGGKIKGAVFFQELRQDIFELSEMQLP